MECLFLIQGEGRGHLTQALALAGLLRRAGHRVGAALVGRSRRRDLPAFFLRKIGAPVVPFDSPNFAADARNQSVRLLPTVLQAVRRSPRYRDSLRVLGAHLERCRPDLVVNFFEPLAGVYYGLHRPAVPMVCVGHQYLVHHPAFPFPPGQALDRWALRRFTDLTAIGASRRLALSFSPLPGAAGQRLSVLPPLLRAELFEQPRGVQEPFLLAYVLNSGYADAIAAWHRRNPEAVLHCFWDRRDAPETYAAAPNLTFHRLDDQRFLSMMARCSGLICTAGFESVCEAMYLGKPVLMVPVCGHYEQQCNALDAVRAGAGLTSATFDLDRFVAYLAAHERPGGAFEAWVETAPRRFVAELEEAAGAGRAAEAWAPALA